MIQRHALNEGWEFRRCEGTAIDADWSPATLPHSPFVADLDGHDHWFGLCLYRRSLRLDPQPAGTRAALHFGAAMHSARVLLDGREIGRHSGGYLPFEVVIGKSCLDGQLHELLVELDNRENSDVPPGKAYGELDFCWYAGLYREVELRFYPPIAISDPLSANQPAGGGVFVRTTEATAERAVLLVRVHACNTGSEPVEVLGSARLCFEQACAAEHSGPPAVLAPGEARHFELEFCVSCPRLWDVRNPQLYELEVSLLQAGSRVCLDSRSLRVGLRRISFSRSGGFTINGERRRLRGTNRHQEQPRSGYAAPRAAELRDARRIKEAGFDYVRLSHYPQSPHFLDACDELGIVVMNAIPGWQFIGGERFRQACFQNARDLIRRDRNHACVVLCELSLNVTAMDEDFRSELQRIGHEEYPGDQMFTCGWMDRYDVYVRARQHGELHSWRNGDKALIVSEYGDWEFYAANEGFDQTTGAGVHAAWSNSRQRRKDGERGLLTQARNQAIALNDTLSSPAVLDGQWSCFDYARGYHPERAACGVMDLHRVPKFSHAFYRSQRDPSETGRGWQGGPMVFIASHWTPSSTLRVTVFSNCEEVALSLNGRLLARQGPSPSWATQYLPHPPFIFDLPAFEPGLLEAQAFIAGQPSASHSVRTPGVPAAVEVIIDRLGIEAAPGESDLLFAHARIVDAHGTLCVDETREVRFEVKGSAMLLGPTRVEAEGGIASIVLKVPPGSVPIDIQAR